MKRSFNFELIGWIAFMIGTLGFLVSALRAGDPWSISASALYIFGIACFMLALRD